MCVTLYYRVYCETIKLEYNSQSTDFSVRWGGQATSRTLLKKWQKITQWELPLNATRSSVTVPPVVSVKPSHGRHHRIPTLSEFRSMTSWIASGFANPVVHCRLPHDRWTLSKQAKSCFSIMRGFVWNLTLCFIWKQLNACDAHFTMTPCGILIESSRN